MLDYMESTRDGSGKCHADDVAAALHFVERLGAVAAPDKISTSPIWMSAIKSYKMEAESSAPIIRKAKPPSVAMLWSWELTVTDTKANFRWSVLDPSP